MCVCVGEGGHVMLVSGREKALLVFQVQTQKDHVMVEVLALIWSRDGWSDNAKSDHLMVEVLVMIWSRDGWSDSADNRLNRYELYLFVFGSSLQVISDSLLIVLCK